MYADHLRPLARIFLNNIHFGNKVMSIRKEKEYQVIRNNLTYDTVGSESDPGPYFRSLLLD